MKIILTVLFLIIANQSLADGLYTGAWSYHYYKDEAEAAGYKINSNQNLIAYERNSYMIGYFKNSFGYDTVIASKYFNLYDNHDIKLGLYAGINYGYRWCGNDYSHNQDAVICPHLIPEFRYTKYKLQPSILLIQYGAALTFRWDI